MTAVSHPVTSDDTADSEHLVLLASWRRHLTAQRMSPATLATYSAAVRGLDRLLAARGLPRNLAELRREHIEAFVTDLLAHRTPATAHNRYRALRSFFGWLADEGEVEASTTDHRISPGSISESPQLTMPGWAG